jgi:hypothetical protein
LILAAARSIDERARLVASAPGVSLRKLKTPQRAAGNPADRWWLDSFDETWIPFAVTAGAVDYYLGRLHDYAAGLSPFGFSATNGDDHGSFTYTATVKPISQPGAVKVVELHMLWSYWCGMMCAIEFIQTRRVFFNSAGKAVRVEGDGQPTVAVS